jgi:glycerol-3-phosphate dehydrogenase
MKSMPLEVEKKRLENIQEISSTHFDALIIGGGINGAVSALALRTHGVNVALFEKNDFASGVSQESSNLVWGGFKYLESYELKLVMELCHSRNRLARAYPSRLVEKRFLAALDSTSPFAPWFATVGANAYWGIGQFATKRPRYRSPRTIKRLEPSIQSDNLVGGIEYSDHLIVDNDSRFVIQMIVDAADRGASVGNYMTVLEADYLKKKWHLKVRDQILDKEFETTSDVLVNTAGPEVSRICNMTETKTESNLVFSKGVHLIVPRVTDSGRILAFFDGTQRLFYVIPMGECSVIGTTDERVKEHEVSVNSDDVDFLLGEANTKLSLSKPLTPEDVIAERVGVRPLVIPKGGVDQDKDWTELSRRHEVETNRRYRMISVLGGKLSDCLNVGEEVVNSLEDLGYKTSKPSTRWYGEPSKAEKSIFVHAAKTNGIAVDVIGELWRRHGSRSFEIIDIISQDYKMGENLSEKINYSPAEISVMKKNEFIYYLDDLLRRRTLIGQTVSQSLLEKDPGFARLIDLIRE